MGSQGQEMFSESRLLEDLREMCLAIDAPFCESTTKKVLQTYGQNFSRGAVNWRTTDRPGDALNYRFYERKKVDTVTPALEAGLLDPANPVLPLLRVWCKLYAGRAEQSCDFCAGRGLVKTWLWLGGLRPLDDILDAPGIPPTITRHRELLHSLGLSRVRHMAFDYHGATVNFYFNKGRRVTGDDIRRFVSVADPRQAAALTDAETAEMCGFLSPNGPEHAVTFSLATGAIRRVALYAFLADRGVYPRGLDPRVKTFFDQARCYDEEPGDIVGWSFGGQRYVKAERNYCGDTVSVMRGWGQGDMRW